MSQPGGVERWEEHCKPYDPLGQDCNGSWLGVGDFVKFRGEVWEIVLPEAPQDMGIITLRHCTDLVKVVCHDSECLRTESPSPGDGDESEV